MEQTNLPVVAKKIWNIARAMYYLLRKGIISKGKLMGDINLMMKRGKIAGKALHNLVFHAAHDHSFSSGHVSYAPREYEFSCSNSPTIMFFKRKHNNYNYNNYNNNHHARFFACTHAPHTDDDVAFGDADVAASPASWACSAMPSPALPGFGRSPAVRRVRITDSPFPLRDVDEDCHVDEAAEEFISKFYSDLRRQNKMTSFR